MLSSGLAWEFDAPVSPDVLPAEAERSAEPGVEEDEPALLLSGVEEDAEELGSVDELDADDEPGVEDDETPVWAFLSDDEEEPTELELLSVWELLEPDWTDDEDEDDLSLLASSSARAVAGENAKVRAVVATARVRTRS